MKTKGSKREAIKELNQGVAFKINDFQSNCTTSASIHLQYCDTDNCKKQQHAANILPISLPLPFFSHFCNYTYVVIIW